MEQRTDEELLVGSLKGHSGDFKTLLERYEQELFGFLYHATGDRQVSEDLFQETFLQVFSNMERFKPEGRFRPWVYTIAANLARDEMRRRRRRKSASLDEEVLPGEGARLADVLSSKSPEPDELAGSRESAMVATKLLGGLPVPLKEVAILYFYNEMKYSEISTALGIPMGTVKSRLFRAIREMSQAMRQRRGF